MSKEPRKFYENEIKELHNSILEISRSCFEYKKLCITTIGIFLGLMLNSIGKHTLFTLENIIFAILSVTFLITLIFHIADSISYYFQRINRNRQNIYKNLLNIIDKNILVEKMGITYHASLLNLSMILYFIIYPILLIGSLILHFISNNYYFLGLTLGIMIALGILTTLFVIFFIAKLCDILTKKKSIFICYTIRDKDIINRASLNDLKKICQDKNLHTYIDLLDNIQIDAQNNVYLELLKSHVFVILKTPNIQKSFWAMHEYKIAQALKMPIIEIDDEDLHSTEWVQKVVTKLKPTLCDRLKNIFFS